MNYKYYKHNDSYYLDVGPMTDEEYFLLKPIVAYLGGHWREKYRSFVFEDDIKEKFEDCLLNGFQISDDYKYKEKNQFYPTPKNIAKRVVELAEIKDGNTVLEPSAGRGGLLDQIDVRCNIIAVEPLDDNVKVLVEKGYECVTTTFEDFYEHNKQKQFERIVMNPPFSEQRDIKHLLMAYELLKEDGILTAIISENALYYRTDWSDKLNEFLKETDAYIEPIPTRSFKESGTAIETIIVKIKKLRKEEKDYV